MSEQTHSRSGRRRRASTRLAVVAVVLAVVFAGPIASTTMVASAQSTQDTREIAYGETVSGAVDSVDPVREAPVDNGHTGDFYYEPVSFEGSAGDVVDIELYGPTDTSLVLVGPDGTEVSMNEDGGPGNNSQVVARLPEDGTYTIQVTSHFPEKSYEYLLSLENLTVDEKSSVSIGETRVGVVDDESSESTRFGGAYDEYRFDAEPGDEVEITMHGSVDSALYLIDREGQVVAQEVAPYAGRDVTLEYTVEQERSYRLIVGSGDEDGEFAYVLETRLAGSVDDQTTDEPTSETSGHTDGGGHAPIGPPESSLNLMSNGLDVTSATLGTPVTYSVTVANYGDAAGTFNESVLVNGAEAARFNGTVEPYTKRTMQVTLTPNQTGKHSVGLPNETTETLTIVPPDSPDGNTVSLADGTEMGIKQNTTSGETVPFEFRVRTNDSTLRTVTVNASGSGTMWLEATSTPLGADGPPAEGLSVQHGFALSPSLQSNGTDATTAMTDGTVTIEVNRSALNTSEASVVVYRQSETGDWEPLPTTRVSSTPDNVTYSATADQFSTVALGTVTPVTSTGSLSTTSMTAGESATVTATVTNSGSAAVDHTVNFAVDGQTVRQQTVTVSPGSEQTVTASISPSAGDHEVTIGGESVGTLTVEQAETPTPTEDSSTPVTTDATETTAGSGPGFGVVVAVLALTAGLLVLGRRRENKP
ncbi:pre-peptidase C-terminal domain-containing protein [Haloarcula marina]|uniref:pre-peptidase C-terminal domain-containing protein n=1 Tax=Haloarcula marina TaxID=2961574 RepID=UPI0020B8BD0D|nr:pre-peptidase C-terminal domain-containing protein [Halomicroarcula marina]